MEPEKQWLFRQDLRVVEMAFLNLNSVLLVVVAHGCATALDFVVLYRNLQKQERDHVQ